MTDIKTPVLNLHSLGVDEDATEGAIVHFKGVAPGAMASILRAMGIAGSTDLRINASYLELKSGSASGQSNWFVPTGSLSSIQGGYQKEFALLVMSPFIFILGVLGDIFISIDQDEFFVLFTYITLFLAIVLLLIYYFTKTMFIEIESGGGMSARVQFKGALSGPDLERALNVMQGVIARAQSDEELTLMVDSTTMPEDIESPPYGKNETSHAEDPIHIKPVAPIKQAEEPIQTKPVAPIQQVAEKRSTHSAQLVTAQQPEEHGNEQSKSTEESPRVRLYAQCVKNGIEIGTFEQFDWAMNDSERRVKFYQQALANNIYLGSFEEFELKIGKQ